MRRSIIGNERGRISLGTWVLFLVVAVLVYLGVKIGPYWIDYYMLKDKIGNFTKMTHTPPDEEIISGVKSIVDERKIPLDVDNNLVITRDDDKLVSIRAEWTVTVEFPGGNTRDLSFVIDAQK